MNNPNIIDSLQSRSDKKTIISEIKNLVLEKLGNHAKETLGEELNEKLSTQLNKDQINSIIQTQITDILTNSYSLKGKLEGLSAEEVEDIINDLEEQYLSKLYPEFSSMNDLKLDFDITAELKLEQSVLQDNIDTNSSSILFIEKSISDLTKENSDNFIVSEFDLSTLDNFVLSALNSEKLRELLSIIESNDFNVENIEDDDIYNKTFSGITKSEAIICLIKTKRISNIPSAILQHKDVLKELINLTNYLSKNTDYDKNMKLVDFIEVSNTKNNTYQESLKSLQQELTQTKSTISTDNTRLTEIEYELNTHENEKSISHSNNTQNIDVLIEEIILLITDIQKNSDHKFMLDNGVNFDESIGALKKTQNFDEFKPVLGAILINIITLSTPETISGNLKKIKKYFSKEYIGGILSQLLPSLSDDTKFHPYSFGMYFSTYEEYNYEFSTSILVLCDDIDKIKQLPNYNNSAIEKLILSGKIIIVYPKTSNPKTRNIDFGIKSKPIRFTKMPTYLSLDTVNGEKAKFTQITFKRVGDKLKAQEIAAVGGKNTLDLPIAIPISIDEVKKATSRNHITKTLKNHGHNAMEVSLDLESTVDKKIVKHHQEHQHIYYNHNEILEKLYNQYIDSDTNESLPIMVNDSVIGEAISQLNNAEAENQDQLRRIVGNIRRYFDDLAQVSLDKSLGRKMLGFEGARGMVGIILSNNVSLYKRYLELNKPDIINKIQLQSEQTGEPVEKILTDLLNNKKSVLEKRIFKLSLGKDYKLKQLENFDLNELIEYYNLTFVRHSIEDFEELMGIKLSTFDRKIAIKNPNSDPHVFDIENASKIKESGKLYKIIESLGEEGIQIEKGYYIKTKSEHYICYVKEHNKFIIASDTVGSVFIFDGNAIDSVKEFGKKSLRELVKEKKGVEKKYNYVDHAKSFKNIFNEIKKSDFGFLDEELESESDINVAEQEKVLELFCNLYTEGLFEIKDVKSIPNFLSQWNTDINNIKSGKKASKYNVKINELISQGYSVDELFMGFKKNSGITVCYSTDQLYYDLGGSIKQIRNYRGYSTYEKRYTDTLVAYKLSGSTDLKAKNIIDSIENSILKNHTANQDNKNLIYLLSKYLDKDTRDNLVTEYTTNPSVHNYNELNVKYGIQSIKSLLISMGVSNIVLKQSTISQNLSDYQDKVAIQNSLYNLDPESLYSLLEKDFSLTKMANYFSCKNELLNFLGIDRDISSEQIQSELVMFNSVKHILEETVGIEEIDEVIQTLDKEDIDIKALIRVANKKSSDFITNKEIDEITNNKKLLNQSINISDLEALDAEGTNKLNYLMGCNVINNISQPVIANYRKKYIIWKLVEKFCFAS